MVTKGYKISLKALRINSDFTVTQVAELLHVSEADVESWEKCDSSPTLEQAKLLAAIYDVKLEDLTYGKFKPAREIFENNIKMLKKANAAGCDYLQVSADGEIMGFRKTKNGELITE